MGQRFPFNLFGGGGSGSSASRDSTNKVHKATGLVAGSAFVVYGTSGGTTTQLGTANADSSGNATVTLATAPSAGTVISYTQTFPGGTIPTSVVALGPTTATITAGAAENSLIAAITGLSVGETATGVNPSDGRVKISGGNALVAGPSAFSATGATPASFTVTTSTGRSFTIAVTANAAAALVQRQVATKTRTYAGTGTVVTANQRIETRSVHTVAYDTPRLRLGYGGYSNSAGGTQEVAITNDVPIQIAVGIGSTVVQAKFAGANQGVIPGGAAIYWTDWLNASDFGLSKFAAGTVISHRYQCDLVAGQKVPFNQAGYETGLESGVASDGTGASQLLSTGALTGTAFSTGAIVPLLIVGEVPDASVAVVAVGASVEQGVGDTGSTIAAGYFDRALRSANGKVIPYCNLAIASSGVLGYINTGSTRRQQLYPYFSHALSGFGSNDLVNSGQSAAATITRLQTLWAQFRSAAGSTIRRVEQTLVIPRVTSTSGNYLSDADQTPIAGFEIGGTLRDALNTAIMNNVGANGLDAIFDMTPAERSPTAFDRWISDGTNKYGTGDGLHPTTRIYQAVAALLATRAASWA